MGGMGLTSAVDIREPAWIGTWALVAGPMRQLHAPFRDLDVSKAPGSDFDELRAAHDRLKKEHGNITATWKAWDDRTEAEYFDLVGGTTGRPPDVEGGRWSRGMSRACDHGRYFVVLFFGERSKFRPYRL